MIWELQSSPNASNLHGSTNELRVKIGFHGIGYSQSYNLALVDDLRIQSGYNIQIIRSPKGNSMTVTVLVILGIIHRRFLTCSVPGHVGKDTTCTSPLTSSAWMCLKKLIQKHTNYNNCTVDCLYIKWWICKIYYNNYTCCTISKHFVPFLVDLPLQK